MDQPEELISPDGMDCAYSSSQIERQAQPHRDVRLRYINTEEEHKNEDKINRTKNVTL